jgi:hypothetical protein
MGIHMIEIVTPAASTRLTSLAAVKADLSITGTASDDALLALIDQFSGAIARWTGMTFGTETVRETFDISRLCDRRSILLDRWPIASITSVTVAGTALATDAYVADLNKGELLYRGTSTRFDLWPIGETSIVYTSGFVLPGAEGRTLPHEVERACIVMVRQAWAGMGRDPSLRSEEVDGVATLTYFAAHGDALSLEAQALLSPYRLALVA